jgi:phage tail-like protein
MPLKVEGDKKTSLILTSWFDVEIDHPKVKAGLSRFNEVSGLSLEITVIEKTETDKLGNTYTSKMAGVTDYKEITLKRNLTPDNGFWLWMKEIRDGNEDFRHAGAIVLYSTADKEIGRWTFENAWPSKWSASDLDAGTDDVIVEEVVLQIEMLKRTK